MAVLLNRNFLLASTRAFLGLLALVIVVIPAVGATPEMESLRSRVEARWTALIAGDFDKAYEFETPAYRALYTAKQYRSRYGGGLRWRQAKIAKADPKSPEVVIVTLEIDYSFQVSGQGMMDYKGPVTETWLWLDGQWWHQLQ